ncbi:UDP-glucosyltransferase 2-like [Anthonomus grandis grandis]|uniref:UDP-glucosyltransferase 2-like n=1 Tax=Anthonomus grandis grandis TaxID=2921223 RepID=UPI0021652F96|nr:UDP-glucosyltransferase 2-like [Anthonomus grandis grandis]
MTTILLLICLFTVHFTNAANILAIIPTASFSHQIPFRPLWKALASKGHNVTLVTTDPMEKQENITQIDMSYGYDHWKKHKIVDIASDNSKSFVEMGVAIRRATNETNVAFFQSPEGQNLIHNRDNRFDLLIVEAQLPAMMVFSWWYQIPFIGVSSLDCSLQYHVSMGNLVHPAITPDPNLILEDIRSMTLWERIQSFTFMSVFRALLHLLTFPNEQKMLQSFFGKGVPPVPEIQDNMSMLFVSTNPIFQNVRALRPNTITLGNGMHLGGGGELKKDVREFLNEATEGAIYFSLGSNIKGRHLNDSVKEALMGAFSKLPYRVIWKIDHKFKVLPPNVIVRKWFASQEAILDHPNVKLFITQGGLQSMQEAVYFAKPMIGIPFFGDQHMNVRRMVQLGYGVKLDKDNITQLSITEAVEEVLNNPRFKEKALEYSAIFKDVDMPNVDKAVWWTEYVIRHKAVRHFRDPTLDMPFWKKNLLDVVGFLLVLFGLIIGVLSWICRCVSKRSIKVSKEKKKA